jgi:ankyrin repeat protein
MADDTAAAAAPSPKHPRPADEPLHVCGLQPVLLDVGRVVALNGYDDECRLLPFLSQDFYREDDYLVACKRVEYGGNRRTRLHALARKGDLARVTRLLRVGADANAWDCNGQQPLHLASGGGHEAVFRLLLEKGVDFRETDSYDMSPLHHACQGGNVAVVRLLLEKGLDSRAKDWRGMTPLHHASQGGHGAVVRLLLEKKVDVNAKDDDDKIPLYLATENGHELVVHLLVEGGSNYSHPWKGKHLLQLARDKGYASIFRFFRKHGVDEG